MRINRWLVRDIEASDSLELFLVSAVSAVLGIRFYLYLSGYPQIGGGGLHIAHMLWGGLLMLVAMILLLMVLNRSAHRVAAVVGGLGFGTFIDELGKFVTRDNNYFFQPTVAIIYVILVLLYLGFRLLDRNMKPTKEEYLINSLTYVQEAIAGDLDQEELSRAKRYLHEAGIDTPESELVEKLLNTGEVVRSKKSVLEKFRHQGALIYQKLVKQRLFIIVVVGVFVFQSAEGLADSVILSNWLARTFPILGIELVKDSFFEEYGYLISVVAANILVVIGVAELFRSRLQAYRIFKLATLVSLLLVQFFNFLTYQFGALWSFGFNLLVLTVLNTLIENERLIKRDD